MLQSIVNRNFPNVGKLKPRINISGAWRSVVQRIRLWLHKHSFGLEIMLSTLILTSIVTVIYVSCIDLEDRHIATLATEQSFKVGEIISCYTSINGGKSHQWVPCTVLSKTQDNRYYFAQYIDSQHQKAARFSSENVGLPLAS